MDLGTLLGTVTSALVLDPAMLSWGLIGIGAVMFVLGGCRRRQRTSFDVTEDTPGRFEVRAVLNSAERGVHREVEALLPKLFPAGARLLCQVSMAEFVYSPDKRDFWTIGASRVDMLIVDRAFQPLCAIEYQGEGHAGRTPPARAKTRHRDWKKRRALRLAGVPLVEIHPGEGRREIAARLGDVTGRTLGPVKELHQAETAAAAGQRPRPA